jgi:hypothetical protein
VSLATYLLGCMSPALELAVRGVLVAPLHGLDGVWFSSMYAT